MQLAYKLAFDILEGTMFVLAIVALAKPTVSIVIPTLCSTLEKDFLITAMSIRAQTRLPDEVVVAASDCANVSFHDFEDLYADLFYPIRTVFRHSKERQPAGVSRNIGYKASNGSHILFFDSDDLMTRDYVRIVMNLFIKMDAKMVLHSFHPKPVNCNGQRPTIQRNTLELKQQAKSHREVWIAGDIHHAHVSVRKDVMQTLFGPEKDGAEDSRFVRDVLGKHCHSPSDCIQTSSKLSVYIASFFQRKMKHKRLSHMLNLFMEQSKISCPDL